MTHLRVREFTAQGILVHALLNMLGKLEKESPDSHTEITPIVVFMAFSIEAYLNSIGFRVVDYWENVERNSWKDKIEILHKLSKKETDWGKEPLQFIHELFKLRDKLAHGKPETIKAKASVINTKPLLPAWYEKLDRNWAKSAEEKYKLGMNYLGNLHDFEKDDYLRHSTETVEFENQNT